MPTNDDIPIEIIAAVRDTLNLFDFMDDIDSDIFQRKVFRNINLFLLESILCKSNKILTTRQL